MEATNMQSLTTSVRTTGGSRDGIGAAEVVTGNSRFRRTPRELRRMRSPEAGGAAQRRAARAKNQDVGLSAQPAFLGLPVTRVGRTRWANARACIEPLPAAPRRRADRDQSTFGPK